MPPKKPDPPREAFLAMQEELTAAYSNEEFQRKLHSRWIETGNDIGQWLLAKMELTSEVNAAILPKYGFEASRKGVQQSNGLVMTKFKNDADVRKKADIMAYWLDPETQGRAATQQEQPSPVEAAGSAPVAAAHSPGPTGLATVQLTREQAWAMQDELLAGLSQPAFQKKLREACREAGPDKNKVKQARIQVCLEVQAPIVAKYGFEPSFKGVLTSFASFHEPHILYDPDIQVRNSAMMFLIEPSLQEPSKVEQGEVRVWQEKESGWEFTCSVFVDPSDDVRRLKQDIEARTGIAELAQHLVGGSGATLHDRELLSTFVLVDSAIDIALVLRRPDITEWLTKLREDREKKRRVLCLSSAPAELLASSDFILPAIEQHPRSLQYAAEPLRGDPGTVLLAVHEAGKVLEFASLELRATAEVVIVAVQRDGWALEFASLELRDNPEVVFHAVSQDGLAFQFASERLKANRELALAAIRGEAWAFCSAAPELQADRELAIAAVAVDSELFEELSAPLRSDVGVVLAAVQQSGLVLQFASLERRAEKQVVLAAVRSNGQALRFADAALLEDADVALAAVQSDGLALPIVAASLHTFELCLAAARQNLQAIPCIASKEMQRRVAQALGIKVEAERGPQLPTPPIKDTKDADTDSKKRKLLDRQCKTMGLSAEASPDEVRRRYRELALQSHPDKHPEDPEGAKRKFQVINGAYQAIKELMGF